jgi:hypothetical protein
LELGAAIGALKKHIRLGRIVKEIDDGLEVYRFKKL